MKILIISRYPPFPGGRENFVFELVNELSKIHEVLILTPDQENYDRENLLIRKYPKKKEDLKKIIESFKPDIINSHTFYLSKDSIQISKNMNIPFGITLHGDQFAIGDKQRQKIVSDIVRTSDFVINVSENGKNSILKNVKNISEDKLYIINNGVNIDKFKKEKVSIKILNRGRFNIDNSKTVILTPSRIATYKGLDFLVDTVIDNKKFLDESYVLFLISIPNYVFSEEEEYMFNAIENKIKVADVRNLIKFIFLKYEEMGRAYSATDFFVLPSQKEQLPMSILEAMSCQIPIISTDVGGIPELLTDNNDALLIPYGDRGKLLTSIKFFLNENTSTLVKNAYTKVIDKYSLGNISKEYENLYSKYANN